MEALKSKLLGMALNFFGLKKLWDMFDGKKSYVGGVSSILLGAGALAAQFAGVQSPAELIALVKALPNDPATMLLLGGLSVVGLRHSNEKLESKPE